MIDPMEIPKAPFWTVSRFCSVVILAAEFRLASLLVGAEPFDPKIASYVLAPSFIGMLCIWFPKELNRLREYVGGEQVAESRSPQELLYYAGWIVLLLPFLLWMLLNPSAI
jgi:hypothetical protein